MERIVNGAPMAIDYGIQDLSTRRLPRSSVPIPQHLPKFYIWAERGPLSEQLVSAAERISTFGEKTFDPYSKFFTHQTAYANLAAEHANVCMLKRLVPDNIGPEANVVLYLDVLETTVDRYERNSDGSIKADRLGQPVLNGTAKGYKVFWVAEHLTQHADVANLGTLTQKVGSQTDSTTGKQSTRYPIFALRAADLGSYGNLLGFRLWAPTSRTVAQMPTDLMAKLNVYPYYFQCVYREDGITTPLVKRTLFNDPYTMVVFKPTAIDPTTKQDVAFATRVRDDWSNTTDTRYDMTTGHFGRMVVFHNNVQELLVKFHAAEAPYAGDTHDFAQQTGTTIDPAQAGLFNIVSGQTSAGVPYESFVFVDAQDAVKMTSEIPVWCGGGSDGDMTDAEFNRLVIRELKRYGDANDSIQDVAYHVESVFYDSGFPVDVKEHFAKVLAYRHDTYVHLGTFEYGNRQLLSGEEFSMAVYLRSKLRMYPESEHYGTPTARASIWGTSGIVRNGVGLGRVPYTYEVLAKSADYFGAGTGRWRADKNFAGAPLSINDTLTDLSEVWVPKSARNRKWDVGLNFVLNYDRSSQFVPAWRTVYSDDTSVLTSYSNVFALCTLNKIQHAAWREFSGTDDKSPAQLSDAVNNFIRAKTAGIFHDRYKIEPNAHFTSLDELRGYSWTLEVGVGMNNMLTVQTQYSTVRRLQDMGA